MFYRTFALVFVSFIAAVAPGASIQRDRPDLFPVRLPGVVNTVGFCRRDASGKLVVTVRNQNNNDVGAHASITRVEFNRGGSFELPTPAIPDNSSVDLQPLAIPQACWSPDCAFTITVDSHNQVHESNEGNNTVAGKCL